ncbi:MAG: excinuclease ABC subunit UvrA [Magnetococcales bacterium]|nr:excinuclease ABC subunit UvrA [Magnetococcales bacterium]
MSDTHIIIRGAREHNLKNLTLSLPRHRLTVITGVSGSGKSSLAFDTLSAEGQRRYVESLSAYARQFLSLQGKPDVDAIEGLSPSISIEQKGTSKNPRSTVGTVTEIHDYLRLLYARIGKPYCHGCGQPIQSQSISQMVDILMALPEKSRLMLLAPVIRDRKGEYKKELAAMARLGFTRVMIDGETCELDQLPVLNKSTKKTIEIIVDRLIIKPGLEGRLADSLATALGAVEALGIKQQTGGLAKVVILDHPNREMIFSERHACPDCGISYPEIEPRMFSFNGPHGACPECDGLGNKPFFDPELVVPDPGRSLEEGAVAPWNKPTAHMARESLQTLSAHYGFDMRLPWKEIPESIRAILLHGSGQEKILFRFRGPRGSFTTSRPWEGIMRNLERRFLETESDEVREELQPYRSSAPCPLCHGQRLRKEALHIRIDGLNIAELSALSLDQAAVRLAHLPLGAMEQAIAGRILKELHERIGFLRALGLDYLTLDRAAVTLSGGEGQRIRLANQIGSGLTGVLYILDEPSIGLHQRDNQRLLDALFRLRDLGNTVVMVEHDEEAIRRADHVVDMGPGAGEQGGRVVAEGSPEQIMADPASLTGRYLGGILTIPVPAQRRRPNPERRILLSGVTTHNLKEVSATIPLGLLVCVTGVSGSGKSSLILDTLLPALMAHLGQGHLPGGHYRAIEGLSWLDKVIHIDQSPIGRTPRSNPATYTGLFTPLRELMASVPEARARGYQAGRFSFNVKGGRCEACAGDGLIKIEMHFLPDIFVQCDQCRGSRYNRETLEICYQGKNIAQILDLTVDDAAVMFQAIPALHARLKTLKEVGMGYVRLGQAATTLSGGEAQRVKIARELAKRATGRTLYILDEPTTGLHFDDIRKLLEVLGQLVEAGNTVLVIEHNLDVIKSADWIIDLGPEGGTQGGEVVMEGTPEQCTRVERSWTGRFLHSVLSLPSA